MAAHDDDDNDNGFGGGDDDVAPMNFARHTGIEPRFCPDWGRSCPATHTCEPYLAQDEDATQMGPDAAAAAAADEAEATQVGTGGTRP